MVAVKLPNIMSGSIKSENILYIKEFEKWCAIRTSLGGMVGVLA